MDAESRTAKSIKNAEVNVFYFVIMMILGFWSRKVFYDYLGAEVLGLDTTAQSLLTFLNLAESGVGAAVAYFLYAPFYNKDYQSINKIVSLQGWIYRRIAFVILVLAGILMCFFPIIFSDISVPLWYAYALFSVLLTGNMLGYYVNYRACILAADQKSYKVTSVTQLFMVLFRILLIVWLPYSSQPFILYLTTTLLGYVIGAIWLNHVIKKDYPWVKSAEENGRELIRQYPDVLKKTKQLFIHRLAGFVVFNCAPLIMYSFSTLTIIAYYGNYLIVTDKVRDLISHVFSSTTASIGNLIASGDRERMTQVFWELNDSRMCISSILVFLLYLITEPFIALWLSPEYLLGNGLLALVLINVWLFVNRSTIDSFKDGFGIFDDIWAPYAEAAINFAVAIAGGYLWGIHGVLCGGIASYVIIVYGWKPYYLYKVGLKANCLTSYFLPYARRMAIVAVLSLGVYLTSKNYPIVADNYVDLFLLAAVYGGIIALVTSVSFYLLTPGMRFFCQRLYDIIKSRKH